MDENEKRFLEAIRNGDLKTVHEMLTSKIIDPNQILNGLRILSYAARYRKSDMVNYLIGHGADVGHNNFEPLKAAVYTMEVSFVEIILEAIKSIGSEEVLIEAVFGIENPEQIGRHYYQRTAFMIAIRDRSNDIIRMFLDLIKDEHRSLFKMEWFLDKEGTSPFHCSCYFELETLDALIEKLPFAHELINLRAEYGPTPLHCVASIGGHREFYDYAKLLISKGLADLNSIDDRGWLPLHWSLVTNQTRMTEEFLNAGCRMDIFNGHGHSPLKITLQMKLRKEIELLLAFGVDLQKEPYLYDEVETPDRFKGDAFAKHRDSSRIHPDLLSAMKALRQWNYMDESPGFKNINSLQRFCRKSIRDYYKPNADEIVSAMENIPAGLKSYLMVENEEEVLAPLVDWEQISIGDIDQERMKIIRG